MPAWQAEDAAALTRELQLLHVTKEFQQLLKAGGQAAAAGSAASRHAEAASLEALLRSRDQLHARRVSSYKRALQRIQDEVAMKQAQSEQVGTLRGKAVKGAGWWFV